MDLCANFVNKKQFYLKINRSQSAECSPVSFLNLSEHQILPIKCEEPVRPDQIARKVLSAWPVGDLPEGTCHRL